MDVVGKTNLIELPPPEVASALVWQSLSLSLSWSSSFGSSYSSCSCSS